MQRSDKVNVTEALREIEAALSEADQDYSRSQNISRDEFNEYEVFVKHYIEKAFIQTLVLLEVLDLMQTYKKLEEIYYEAKKKGFLESTMGIEEPYLLYGGILYTYVNAIGNSFNVGSSRTLISKDITSILKEIVYSITDPELFDSPPVNELEVHKRIEAVLRCVFPDLKHEPTITKQIKNFKPDTGLPSIATLIEYKFVSSKKQAKIVTDQLLADTRGYVSKDWKTFLYVIYETHRVHSQSQWNQLLAECDIGHNTKVVVISGEPAKGRKIRKQKSNKKNKKA
jgi:hypothetical protein